MLSIPSLLTKLEKWMEINYPEESNSFNPGLTLGAITSREEEIGFSIPTCIRELYQWHDGAREGLPLLLFPDADFLPLNYAIINSLGWNNPILQEYREIAEEETWVRSPLFIFAMSCNAAGFYGVPLSRAKEHSQPPVVCGGEGEFPNIYYTSLTSMIATLVEGYELDILSKNKNGIICKDKVEFSHIFRKHNLGLPEETFAKVQLRFLDAD